MMQRNEGGQPSHVSNGIIGVDPDEWMPLGGDDVRVHVVDSGKERGLVFGTCGCCKDRQWILEGRIVGNIHR